MPVPTHELPGRLRSLPDAARLLDALAGEPAVWVVGGAVRDLLLGRTPSELDLVVEGDATEVARRAAERLNGGATLHARFGTATVEAPGLRFDLAGARRERYARPGALPEVELGATLHDDLARRDFTVNAIALHLTDGEVTAWPGALEDLEARRLRVLHERSFADDPTRLLRLVRYAARLGFAMEERTRSLAAQAVAEGAPATVTGPRLGSELWLAAREPQPAAMCGLEALRLGPALLPGFALDPDLLERALRLCPADAETGVVALAACCVGADAEELGAAFDGLGFRARERDGVVAAATRAEPLAAELPALTRPSAVWELLHREAPETVALAGAFGGEGPAAAVAGRWLKDLRHVRLALTGDDLLAAGLEGPAVGRALEAAMAATLDGAANGREEQLAAALAAQPPE